MVTLYFTVCCGTQWPSIFIVLFMYSYCHICSVLYILLSSCQLALFGYLTEGFPCIFLSCEANARVKLAKTGARPALFPLSDNVYAVSSLLVLF